LQTPGQRPAPWSGSAFSWQQGNTPGPRHRRSSSRCLHPSALPPVITERIHVCAHIRVLGNHQDNDQEKESKRKREKAREKKRKREKERKRETDRERERAVLGPISITRIPRTTMVMIMAKASVTSSFVREYSLQFPLLQASCSSLSESVSEYSPLVSLVASASVVCAAAQNVFASSPLSVLRHIDISVLYHFYIQCTHTHTHTHTHTYTHGVACALRGSAAHVSASACNAMPPEGSIEPTV
jgi:hypothetical protein